MDLSSCRTCLTRRSSSVRLSLFDMRDEMTENIKFITDIEVRWCNFVALNELLIQLKLFSSHFRSPTLSSACAMIAFVRLR